MSPFQPCFDQVMIQIIQSHLVEMTHQTLLPTDLVKEGFSARKVPNCFYNQQTAILSSGNF